MYEASFHYSTLEVIFLLSLWNGDDGTPERRRKLKGRMVGIKGHLLYKIHFFMSLIHKHVSPLCKDILKVSGKKIHSVFGLIHLYSGSLFSSKVTDRESALLKQGWNRGVCGMLQCTICLVFRATHFRYMICIYLETYNILMKNTIIGDL